MAVNYIPYSMDGHNPQNKIGVITNSTLGEPLEDGAVPVIINGYIYAHDFEDAAVAIKLNQASLGFSYETAKTLLMDGLYEGEEIAVVSQLGYFTGASILLKDSAAYTSTALAASKEEEVPEMDLEKLLQSISDMIDEKLAKFAKEDEKQDEKDIEKAEEKEEVKAEDEKPEGDEEKPEEKADEAKDEEKEEVKAEDEGEEKPEEEAKEEEEMKAEEVKEDEDGNEPVEEDDKEKDDLKAEIEALKAELAGLKASVDLTASARKSVPYPTTLMAKYEIKEDSYENLMAAIDKMENLSIEERMALKFEARQKSQGK
jgi:hypothetical protein